MAKVEEIKPRKGRFHRYCILYTEAGNFCCSEDVAQKLCLFEPYAFEGQVNFARGGTFLWVTKAALFDPRGWKGGQTQIL